MIEKWVNFKRDYLEISFLRENWVCATSPYHRRFVWPITSSFLMGWFDPCKFVILVLIYNNFSYFLLWFQQSYQAEIGSLQQELEKLSEKTKKKQER